MQKTNRKDEKRPGVIGELLRGEIEKRKTQPYAFLEDIIVFVCALIFARTSLIFGTRPLGLAFVAVLPTHTWIALIGAVIGSLSLGMPGVIFAMICAIIVFLRVIISGTDVKEMEKSNPITLVSDSEKAKESKHSAIHPTTKLLEMLNLTAFIKRENEYGLFKENVLLRMSSAVIGGFICAVYEILLSGFALRGVLFGIGMIIFPALLTLALSGLFESDVSFREILGDGKAVFIDRKRKNKESLTFFRISALIATLCLSLSLNEYTIFGISASLVFASLVTLFVAKRFGAISAAAIGFASAIGISSLQALGLTLLGISAGALFGINRLYALIGGGMVLFAFSAYSNGILGVTSIMPEYIIAALITYPIARAMPTERGGEESEKCEKNATDMVGTMALFYKSKAHKALSHLAPALRNLAIDVEKFTTEKPQLFEYEAVVQREVKKFAPTVEYDENIAKIAIKVYNCERIDETDFAFYDFAPEELEELIDSINKSLTAFVKCSPRASEELASLSALVRELSFLEETEMNMDEALTDKLENAISELGFSDGVVRAFGNRQKHLILAGQDDDGTLITSPQLKKALEAASEVALGSYEYFRKGKMVLLECDAVPKYQVEYAFATVGGSSGEPTGDLAVSFKSDNGYFYSAILDGMGSGIAAARAAEFSSGVLSSMLKINASPEGVFHLLNTLLRHGTEECSVSVDLFKLDLLNREAVFFKSGAAPSYVKRASSVFRVRSATAPLGLMSAIDSEKIKVQIESGDYVIMLSDGISQSPEDAPWLLELISSQVQHSVQEYANLILKEAKSRVRRYDDMTVVVMKINENKTDF